MLKLDEKDYDVNNLLGINFDILKEVLLKLSQNQTNIQIEIKEVKDSNEERDNKITELENKITELNNLINTKEKFYPYEIEEKHIKKPIENIDIKNIIEKDNSKENIIENEKEKENESINDYRSISINNDNNDDDDENKSVNKEFETNNSNKTYKDDFLKKESINIETKINLIENEIKEEEDIIPKEEYNNVNEERPKTHEKKIDNNYIKENEIEKRKKNLTYYKEKENEKDIKIEKDKKNEEKDEEQYEDLDKEKYTDKKRNKDKPKKTLYKTSRDIIDLNSAVLQKTQVSYDVIRKILHTINEINEKIDILDRNFNKKCDEIKEYSDNILSEQNKQVIKKFNIYKKKIDDLNEKNDQIIEGLEKFDKIEKKLEKINEIEKKLKEIEKKNSKPEIIQIFNDDDNNEKMMSSTMKEEIDKNFELNENRYMQAAGDNIELKNKYLNIKGITDNLNRQINLLRNAYDSMKKDMDKIKIEYKDLIENKNNELKNEIKEQIDKNLEDINNNIDKKNRELLNLLMEEKNNNNKDINNENTFDMNAYKADKALTKLLNKRVTELTEKIEKLEERIKNHNNKNIPTNKEELDEVKQCIVELYDNINNKIGKADLKELYGFYLEHVNEIKFIKAKLTDLTEMQEKIRSNTPNFIKRLETLTFEINELQENAKKKVVATREKPVDLTNYITEKKLKNILTPISEELEKLMSESVYNSKMLSEIMDQVKSFDKKSHVDHIESDLNEKINMLNNRYSKKFIEKIEFNKIIKNIDIQIKLLQGTLNNKKEEADSWLLAKQPIKCFNCATCEANIANSTPVNEYLPWNKYPHGEKQYRIGQGFSKLLNKLKKNIDDNNKLDKIDKNKLLINSFDHDKSNKFLSNNINNINESMKINYRIPNKEEKNIAINIKKFKLPRVIESFRKKQKSVETIPITDDEKENDEVFIEQENENNSPKILKITKVKNDNELIRHPLSNKNSRNRSETNSGNKLNRIQSVPFY